MRVSWNGTIEFFRGEFDRGPALRVGCGSRARPDGEPAGVSDLPDHAVNVAGSEVIVLQSNAQVALLVAIDAQTRRKAILHRLAESSRQAGVAGCVRLVNLIPVLALAGAA